MQRILMLSVFLICFGIIVNANHNYRTIPDSNEQNNITGLGCTISYQRVETDNPNGCSGSEDGRICVTINSTVSEDFELSIDNGSTWTYGKGTVCAEDLGSGNYYLQIKDEGGCIVIYSGNPVVLGVDDPITINEINTLPETYSELGSIIVNASGIPPLQYRIDNGTWQTSEKFIDLIAGTYIVDVKDVNGCIISDEAIVVDERCPEFTASRTIESNCFSPNGTITITTSIGTRPLSYSNDNGSTWQSDSVFVDLPGRLYQLAVRGNNGCITYGSINVGTSFINFSGSSTVINVTTCMGDATGEIRASSFGGKSPKTYSINNGTSWQSSGTFTGLTAGVYQAIVMDFFGCTDTAVFTITQPIHDTINFVMVENVNGCSGDSTGEIAIDELFPAPPAPPSKSGTVTKSYSIDGGATWQSGNFFYHLPAGEYTAVVKVDGCEYPYYLNPVVIDEPDPVEITNVSVAGDYGNSSGEITITATGGGMGFEYSIDGGTTFSFEETFTGLANGVYNLFVHDYLGCSADSIVSVPDWSITISNVTYTDSLPCYNSENGSITIFASGGAGTLNYTIDNGNHWQASNEFTHIFGGEYIIQVKDANNSIVSWSGNPVVLFEPDEIYFDYDISHPTCEGINDGTIEFFDVEGGTGNYWFSIDGGETYSPESLFDSLAPGDYDIIVADGNGCTVDDNIYLRDPEPFEIHAEVINISCFGNSDGKINCGDFILGISKPDEISHEAKTSYYYSIDNGITWQADELFENLQAGEYYVWKKISDACMKAYEQNPVIIDEPEKLIINSVSISSDDGTSNGRITVSSTGGTGIREYSIDGGITFHWGEFDNLSFGDYTIIVRDDNGCTIDSLVTVLYDPIHDYEHIYNSSYNMGDTTCIGAYRIITVGDSYENPVDFNVGSSTSLIAGNSISLLPGIHIYEGAYFTATITTDSSFCEEVEALSNTVITIKTEEKSETFNPVQPQTLTTLSMKVFPNPNNGRFYIELNGFNGSTEFIIYNSIGSIVCRKQSILSGELFEMNSIFKGLYFIKASDGFQSVTQKMIIE